MSSYRIKDYRSEQRRLRNEGQTSVRRVKSAARAIEVLEFLGSRDSRPARLREICETLGAPRSSLYALLKTMVAMGWVRTDASGTFYGIGIRALLIGTNYLDSDSFLPIVRRALETLNRELDETFHFARLDGTDVVYLATQESSQYLRPFSRVGRRLPAYCTALGKAILAGFEGTELEAHLPASLEPLTPHTLVHRPALDASLAEARRSGLATDFQESSLGLKCFAVALPYASPATDAISASIPLARLTEETERTVVAALRRAGEAIAREARSLGNFARWPSSPRSRPG
jgi:DNA-binding IclR family transcriptional regulator